MKKLFCLFTILLSLTATVFAASGELSVTVPKGASVNLKKGFSTGTKVAEAQKQTTGDRTVYTFTDCTAGIYYVTVSGSGLASLVQPGGCRHRQKLRDRPGPAGKRCFPANKQDPALLPGNHG